MRRAHDDSNQEYYQFTAHTTANGFYDGEAYCQPSRSHSPDINKNAG